MQVIDIPTHAPTQTATLTPARRFGRRLLAVVFGLAAPTGLLAWVLGFDPIKRRVNGRLWCSTADEVLLEVHVKRSGASTRYTDELVCRTNGTVVRTVRDLPMMATTVGVAFVISLLLFLLLVIGLRMYASVRRRHRVTH